MRILILQDVLRSGGTERQSVLLANDLAAAGHTVTLLTFRPGGKLNDTVVRAVRRHSLQPFDTGLDWFAPNLSSVIEEIMPKVIVCMGRMANCYAGRLQRNHPEAVVISTMRTGKNLPWLFRRSLHQTRHVVANSREAARLLEQRHAVPSEKISVIHNSLVFSPDGGTDRLGQPNEAALALRNRLGASAMTPVMLCVAMFRPEKNQRELIELAAQLSDEEDWQLWLAGDGVARPVCERLVAEKNLAHRIKLVGFHPDPRPLYRAADVAVLTSRSESLSNFLIEAHAHGLPSVAYSIVGVAECGGAVVEAGNQHQFLETLRPLLFDPQQRKISACQVAEYAARHFSRESQVAAYVELFEKLVHPA